MKVLDIPEDIGEYLSYDPETGHLTWKETHRQAGNIAGGSDGCYGYLKLRFRNRQYRNHRVAWFLQTGEQLGAGVIIDHKNHVKDDNRWDNLRLATFTQNNAYSRRTQRSLPRGVYPLKRPKGHYQVTIRTDGRTRYLGTFKTPEEASVVFEEAFNAHHGSEWNVAFLHA